MPILWNWTKIIRNFDLLALIFLFIFDMPLTCVVILLFFAWTEHDENADNVTYEDCYENVLQMYGLDSNKIASTLQKDKDFVENLSNSGWNEKNETEEEAVKNILKKTIKGEKEYDSDEEEQESALNYGLKDDVDFVEEMALNEYLYNTYLSAPDMSEYKKSDLLKNHIDIILSDSKEKTDWDNPDNDNYFVTAKIKNK